MLCTQDAQCGTGNCLTDVTDAALQRCCPSTCGANQRCSAQGQCQNPPQGAGNACSADADCATGLFCRDGVCCTSRCDRPCETCGAGTGTCNITPVSDPGRCGAVTCSLQSNTCRTVTPPQSGQCAALGQCVGNAQCVVSNALAGTRCNGTGACDGAGNCIADTTAPSVGGGSISASGSSFDDRTLSWSTASDGAAGTPPSQLRYFIYHSFTNNLGTLAQTLAATQIAEAVGATSQLVRLPRGSDGRRSSQHVVNVVVADAADNMAVYSSLQLTLADPTSCTADAECLGEVCFTLFADADADCRGDVGTTLRSCTAPSISTNSCPQPRSAVSGLAGVTVGGTRYINNSVDCFDRNNTVYPQQPGFFATGFTPPAGSTLNQFDYNCSGALETALPLFAGCAGTVPDPPGSGNCQRADGSNEAGYANAQGAPSTAPCGSDVDNFVAQCVTLGATCSRIGNQTAKACH